MKKNTVYFLGAGASKNFGYPLTNEIMPEILIRLSKNNLFQSDSYRSSIEIEKENQLRNFIYTMYPGLVDIDLLKEKTRIPNITEVLSMVDYCCLYNFPPHPSLCDDTLIYFRDLLNRAIVEILLKYVPENIENINKSITKFNEQIKFKIENENVTIITSNYDLVIEKIIKEHYNFAKVDFGISYRDVITNKIIYPESTRLQYYKLHGSMNWLK